MNRFIIYKFSNEDDDIKDLDRDDPDIKPKSHKEERRIKEEQEERDFKVWS